MKKIYLSICAIFVVVALLLSGCTKAENATLLDCKNFFEQTVGAYSGESKYLYNSTSKQWDLYTQQAYQGSQIYQTAEQEAQGFVMLKQGKQYQVLLKTASSFYQNYQAYLNLQDVIDYESKVTKQQKTTLYTAIENLKPVCDSVSNLKDTLKTVCTTTFDPTKDVVQKNLKRFLIEYQRLIDAQIKISLAMEDIYANNMVINTQTTIFAGEGKRIVESAKLYVVSYIFDTYFNFEDGRVLTDISSNQAFLKLVELDNLVAKNFSAEPTEQEIESYNFAIEKLERFKTQIKNYKLAKQQYDLADKSSPEFINNPYKQFVENFEQEVVEFANFVLVTMSA